MEKERFMMFSLCWMLFQIIFTDGLETCDPPCLIVCNLKSVIRLPLNKSTGKPITGAKAQIIMKTSGHTRSLAIDQIKNEIYWGDFKYNTINKSSIDGSNLQTLFNYGIGYPQGLAIDWSSDVIYWTDSMMKRIEVSDTRGNNRKVLFTLDKDSEPRGIIADPVEGFLFWTDWGTRPRIERATLAGENRTAIVSSNITWPNDLAIDHQRKRLYWIDAKFDAIYSCTFDGGDITILHVLRYNNERPHPYSLARSSHGYFFFSDWHTDSVYMANINKSIAGNVTEIFKNNEKERNLGQVRVYDGITYKASRPCQNHTCSHLCLKSGPESHVCVCPTGMKLSPINSNKCVEAKREYEIYFADSYAKSVNHLVKYDGQPGVKVRPLSVPSNERIEYPIGLDYDQEEKMIYWTDRKTGKTYRMKEDGENFEVIVNHKISSIGLAIDKINKIMYWFENHTTLVMSKLNGKDRKILVKFLSFPRDIALYEEKAYVYFTDVRHMKLYRILSDGTNLLSLYIRGKATGIAVDKVEDRVYWCDTLTQSIQSVDLNFRNRRKLIQKTFYIKGFFWLIRSRGFVVNPFSVAVHGDKVFWSDTRKRAIFSADKHSGGNIEYITGGLDHPRDIHIYTNITGNKTRKMYLITFLPSRYNSKRAYCNITCPADKNFSHIPDPKPCPRGYEEKRFGSSCSNCSDPLGGNFKCECKDWKTCAQRGYGQFIGCKANQPFMMFKVRECVQVIKPGFCKFELAGSCLNDTKSCDSDSDCHGNEKCCRTSCSSVCRDPIEKSDHPCAKNNGGCSHFCVSNGTTYKCLCPEGYHVDTNGKNCTNVKQPLISEICKMPAEHGPCQPFVSYTRWFHNDKTKKCEMFSYGGCLGNHNNFKTKEVCDKNCAGSCPVLESIGTCMVTNNTCLEDSECPDGKRCCNNGCGKQCLEIDQKSLSRCLLPRPNGICKPNIQLLWYYDVNQRRCQQYHSNGCHTTNENSFESKEDCKNACFTSYVCNMTQDRGPCKTITHRWYFDTITKSCRKFIYGGCFGNQNNFKSQSDCEQWCPVATYSTTTMATTASTVITKISEKPTTESRNTTKYPNTTITLVQNRTTKAASEPAEPAAPESTWTPTTKTSTSENITTPKTIIKTTKILKATTKASSTTAQGSRNPCVKNPCMHGGSCLNIDGKVLCKCPKDYSGHNCEQHIDPMDYCTKNPCENGGSCINGAKKAICNCTGVYFGSRCEQNPGTNLIKPRLVSNKKHNKEYIKEQMTTGLTIFCLHNTCFAPKRKRRESQPYHLVFTKEDIILVDFKQDADYTMHMKLAVLEPKHNPDDTQDVMKSSELRSILENYNNIIPDPSIYFDGYDEPKNEMFSQRKKSTVGVVVGLLVTLSVLAIVVFAVWYWKKKNENKQPIPKELGPVSYENELYDDLHSSDVNSEDRIGKVELPDFHSNYDNRQTPFSDYAEVAATEGHILPVYENHRIAVSGDGVSGNNTPKDWVKFNNENDMSAEAISPDTRKVPITSFVQANYQDPYDIDVVLSDQPINPSEYPSHDLLSVTTTLSKFNNKRLTDIEDPMPNTSEDVPSTNNGDIQFNVKTCIDGEEEC